MRLRASLGFQLAVMLPVTVAMYSQEPAMVSGNPGVRFEEHPDQYHYIVPCDSNGSAGVAPMMALCWPVLAGYLHLQDGKPVQSAPASGIIKVSPETIGFFPSSAAPDNPKRELSKVGLTFKHEAGTTTAIVGNATEGYIFTFQWVCFECKAGAAPVDAGKPAQLDMEFNLMQEALTSFAGIHERLKALSQQKRVKVTPADEPGLAAISKNLELWSDLNHKLAAACTEPAKSCLQSYAEFQACAANPHAGCAMVKPSCTAVCVLPSTFDMQGIRASAPPQLDALQLAPAGLEIAGMAGGSPGGVMGGMAVPGEGLHAPTGIPKNIQMVKEGARPPGVAGMSPGGVLGGTGATGITVQAGPLKPGVARISGGVMAGQMVNKVQPVYPPVARAAHMGGTVVMHAIISKQGTVESLEVASSTNPLFNNAALDAVKQWQYKPYLLNGEPTEVDTTITVNFNLGGPPAAPGGAPAAAPAPAVPPS